MKQFKKSALNWWNNFVYRVQNQGEDKWSLMHEHSILVINKNALEVSRVRFDEVVSITTYKKDFVTYDPVFLCFLDKNGRTVEIWEDMTGFHSFVCHELERYFDVESAWFANVNRGTFAENRREIWRLKIDGGV